MNDHGSILGLVNRLYKLQRCDRLDQQHLIAPGDLIEYIRGPFSHWAVYLGHDRIAHLPGPSNLFANFQVKDTSHDATRLAFAVHVQIFQTLWRWMFGHSIEPMEIEIRDFGGLLSTSIAYINNSKDRILRPSANEEILRRAYNAVGLPGYDLLLNNCEHFAHWCRFVLSDVRVLLPSALFMFRYGIAVSDQVFSFLSLTSSLGLLLCFTAWTKRVSRTHLSIASGILLGSALYAATMYRH